VALGRCWIILRDNFPEYRESHVRYPYPAIGERAYGKPMRHVVTAAINLTLLGVATVFLLLANQNLQSLFMRVGVDVSYCYLILITGACLIPLVCIGTPKDFWPIAVTALISTSIACILIVVAVVMDAPNHKPVKHTQPDVLSYFKTFGTILFSFGGAAIFPSIQHDMKEPAVFSRVVLSSYTILLCLYLPVASAGYFVYGDDLKDNIMDSLPIGGLRDAGDLLLAIHLLMAFTIAVNPSCQQLEETLGIDIRFSWKRVVVRSVIVVFIVFVGESIPHFGAILDFIGGSTVTFLTFVAPSIFYYRLRFKFEEWQSAKDFLRSGVHPAVVGLNILIVTAGIIGGGISTYAAIQELADKSTFIPPCYVNITAASRAGE